MPHIKPEYFEDAGDKEIFKAIDAFNKKYNKAPSVDSLFIDIEASPTMADDTWDVVQLTLNYMKEIPDVEPLWRFQQTEKWAKEQAVFIAFSTGVDIMQGDDKTRRSEIPDLMTEALNISFDNSIGIEYGRNPEEQYDFYHSVESIVETDIDILNKVLKGGFRKKTLSVLMSNKTGGFKSGTMCHISAAAQTMGYNVLYITLELAEREILRRTDANLINTPLDDIKKIPRATYVNRINQVKKNLTGRLFVQEYPPTSAHAGHFRFLLKELAAKQKFKPDLICIDYLNICASSRYDAGRHNSYTIIKGIAEELRSIAMEYDVAILTGTQSGRQGVKAGMKIDLDDVSESYGLPATADVMFAIIDDEECNNKNLLVFKQIKNRFGDIHVNPYLKIGVQKSKMMLHDVDNDWTDTEATKKPKKEDAITWNETTKLKTDDFVF
ncbi:MAG: DnaB-like helicase C-terminal domain-containing protein [Candidatus Izemoplasma sp.]